MTTQSRQYSNPPLHEALVEFRFAEPERWSPTVPGVMSVDQTIMDRYDGENEEAAPAGVTFNLNLGPGNLIIGQQPNKVRFQSEDKTCLMLVGRDALSVHRVNDYPGWPTFVDEVKKALAALDGAMKVERGITRIGVRYINRIPIPSLESDFADYLSTVSAVHGGLEGTRTGYRDASEYRLEEPMSRLVVQQSSQRLSDDEFALMLDIDAIAEFPEPLAERNEALKLVDELHDMIVRVFESSVTDEAKEKFQ